MSIIKKLINIISKYFYDIKHFNICVAHYNFWCEFANFNLLPFGLNKKVKEKKFYYVYNFLSAKYADFIKGYTNEKTKAGINKKIIWCCWWQGEYNAPNLVKICINSIKKNACGYKVVIIDKTNYNKYISLPKNIIDKVENKKISITHLSDIIRMALLSKYGGIWVDATMYVRNDIFKKFDNINLNSNYPNLIANGYGSDKWCGFFIGGRSNKTFSFVYDFFIKYHHDYDRLINYFLIDYAIHIAYNNFQDCKNDIDNINIHNNDIFRLVEVFNLTYEKSEYEKLMEKGFFKLTYKQHFNKYDKNGQLTNYGFFIKENMKDINYGSMRED